MEYSTFLTQLSVEVLLCAIIGSSVSHCLARSRSKRIHTTAMHVIKVTSDKKPTNFSQKSL